MVKHTADATADTDTERDVDDNPDPTEISDRPFTAHERRRLRRLLQEDYDAKIIAEDRRGTVKVWFVWIGSSAAILVAGKTLFWEFVKSYLK